MGLILAFIIGIALALVAIVSGYAFTYFFGLVGIGVMLGLYFTLRDAWHRRPERSPSDRGHERRPLEQLGVVPVAPQSRRLH